MIRKLTLLFLFFCGSLLAKWEVSVCAIFQNDAQFLREWAAFHLLQGVDHFYLYNNSSEDDYLEALRPLLKKGLVTLIDWPYSYEAGDHNGWYTIQTGAYMHCLRNFGQESRWVAIIDTDEFLFCPSQKLLSEFLCDYEGYAGLGVNWLQFGTSGVEEVAPGKLMIELLTKCASRNHIRNQIYKSIVQPQYVVDCDNPHYFVYQEGFFAVDAEKNPLRDRIFANKILLDDIRINHYWSRTAKYYREVKMKNRQKRLKKLTKKEQKKMLGWYSKSEDFAIMPHVELLGAFMSYLQDISQDISQDIEQDSSQG